MLRRLALATLLAVLFAPVLDLTANQATQPLFTVSFAASARAEATTGRVYVAISRANDRQTPIRQAGPTGTPLFSLPIEQLAPGAEIRFSPAVEGHPVATLADLPPGEYWVQPFVNVYTRFPRADGHIVWMHMDQWEGQNWRTSPGNLFGDPVKVTFNPASGTPIRLVADKVIPPIIPPADTEYVKRSVEHYTKWWGADLMAPRCYTRAMTNTRTKYPIVFSRPLLHRRAGRLRSGRATSTGWAARVIHVTQHPSYDDSCGELREQRPVR